MQLERENIILDTDPRIRQKSEPVSLPLSGEDKELLEAMVQYVKDSQDEAQVEQRGLQPAIGIAAIQLGIPKQMLAVYLPDEDGVHQAALANPKIISKSVQNSYLENGEG
ncbi:MAG: peptide deformylase, partial [Erysipelotrichaceae bacterium]|nr:peptide deformylase [Erysipelotrichaceae bacterium]